MTKTIGTHNGNFHADDVFAMATLKKLFGDIEVVRTRDPKVLEGCDFVVDVGGGELDHHMRGGAGARDNGIPLAAFGLVWKNFGPQICDDEVVEMVDCSLVQQIDASDCGVALTDNKIEDVHPVTVSHMISAMNPGWNESPDFDDEFMKAVAIAGVVLEREICRAQGLIEARTIVRDGIGKSEDGRLVVLDRFAPWQEVVVSESEALFVAFPGITGDWKLQCVPSSLGSFEKRKELPELWAGKRDQELCDLTGVAGAVFCHPGRFICGADSREGILKMAGIALES